MLQICPKLPNQQFEELPFEEAILTFLRDLGHSGEIKMITDVNVNKLHQPWRSFAAEEFVYQVKNKNVKKSNEMHEDTQLYGVILPDKLMNEAIKDFESYKEYYVIASGAKPLKSKASVKKKQVGSDMSKTPPTKGKRLKTSVKAAKTANKKQPAKTTKAKGLTVLSEVALTEAEQMKLATKRSLMQNHSSHASGSGADKGTGDIPGVLDVPTYGSDEQISWKSSKEEDHTEPKMAKKIDELMMKEQGDDEEQTIQDNDYANVEGDKMNEEETNEEAEVDALYRDVNVNLEGKDIEMTDAPRTIIQTTQVKEDTHTSHAVAANLSELELKKILIDKMKSNKSINRSNKQRNLYKALVDAYESDKLILDTYRDTILFKRRRDDEDKYEEPFARSNRGSKRRRVGKEPESTSAPKEKTSKTTGKSTEGSKSHHMSTGESAQAEEPMHTAKDLEEPTH
ncbi:hypothetical protein Tco_1143680 [Tanacetum coccineum]